MKKFLTGLCMTVAVWMVAVLPVHAEVSTGQPAPEFTLTDTEGKDHLLVNLKGKYVILEWLNYDCPFVKKHYSSNNMQSLQKEYTDKGAVWLSIVSSAEGKEGYYKPAELNKMSQERKANQTAILVDSSGKVGRLYGAKTTPHMYIIDPNGILVYQGAIDDNNSADAADVAAAKNYVKMAMNDLLAGRPVAENTTKSYGCSVKY